jgi:hypothetical protein
MEENKNEKYIVLIVVLALLVGLFAGLFVYKEFFAKTKTSTGEVNTVQESKENTSEKETSKLDNLDSVKEYVNKVFTEFSNMDSKYGCASLASSKFDFASGNNLFQTYGGQIMKFVNGEEYVNIDSQISSYVLMSSEQYAKFNEYFDNVKLTDYTGLQNTQDLTQEQIDKDLKYANKGYKIAYSYGDGCGYEGDIYKVDNVYKNGDYYYATILAGENHEEGSTTQNYTYKGTFKIEIVNNHYKFYSLVFSNK